jgi:tetrapyrrole methylase family protein / MazG family protein
MNFYDLIKLMAVLRSPEGCPWDRAQKVEDLMPYVMEEALELVEAVASREDEKIKEELGDLLFEIIFVARIKEEEGCFAIDDAMEAIGNKMIERHPHVFGQKRLDTPDEVQINWEKIKAKKRKDDSALAGITEDLPALIIAHKYGLRASEAGFDWENVNGVLDKVREEFAELEEVMHSSDFERKEEEFGDILFSICNLARFLKVNPELALRKANRKFARRYRYMEQAIKEKGGTLSGMKIDELETLWREAKSALENR